MIKKLLSFSMLALLFFAFAACTSDSQRDENITDSSSQVGAVNGGPSAEAMSTDSDGLSSTTATIRTVHGDIVFKFYPNEAPNTVTRISQLISEGFYDGLTFHRVVPNFVVQGGDPQGTGTGGSGQKLKAEFNDIQHVRGTVAMARAQDINSADSQFYIALSTLPHLDGQYTVFGQVVEGLELLDKITVGDKMLSVILSE